MSEIATHSTSRSISKTSNQTNLYKVAGVAALLAVLVAWLLLDAAALLHRVAPRATAIAPVAVGLVMAALLGRDRGDGSYSPEDS